MINWILAFFNKKYRSCKTGWHTWDNPIKLPDDPEECQRRVIKQTCNCCGLTQQLVGWRYSLASCGEDDYSPRYSNPEDDDDDDDFEDDFEDDDDED